MLQHHPVGKLKTAPTFKYLSGNQEGGARVREKDSLSVSLEDVDRVDGWVPEVPQSEGGVSG